MSSPPSPATITYEQMMTLFLETREQMKERDLAWEERAKRLDQKISDLGDRVGQLVESMVEGGIIRLFQEKGYEFDVCNRHVDFKNKTLNLRGEIDLFLENGEYALLVEVKTNLSIDDIKDHIIRLEKYRRFADFRNDKRRFLAAVGGGVVRDHVREFALKQGMYVVQQSGENVEIISPEGEPKVW